VAAHYGNPGEREMEVLVVVLRHLPQEAKHRNHCDLQPLHMEAVESVVAHQAMPLGGTDGNGDRHYQDTSHETLLPEQNHDRSHCSYHALALEVATFQHGRN